MGVAERQSCPSLDSLARGTALLDPLFVVGRLGRHSKSSVKAHSELNSAHRTGQIHHPHLAEERG